MLTGKERIAVFQLMEIPLRKPVDIDEALANMRSSYDEDAINQIDDWLASISTDEETEVKAILTKYQTIKYNTVSVKTDKVSLNYNLERSKLQDQLRIILPLNSSDLVDDTVMVVG